MTPKIGYTTSNKIRCLGAAGNSPRRDRTTLEVAGMPSLSPRTPRDKSIRTSPKQIAIPCHTCGTTLYHELRRTHRARRFFCNAECRAKGIRIPLADRFWPKVNKHSGRWWRGTECWEWTAKRSPTGYGYIGRGGRAGMRLVHRLSYELAYGEIPEGLEIDHRCRNRCCVRPEHLEPVTHLENIRRGNQHRHSSQKGAA